MALLVVQLLTAAAAYAFGVYCGVVIFRNFQTRQVAKDKSIACSPFLAVALLVVVTFFEILVYAQIVVFEAIEVPFLGLSLGYNLIWPLLYGIICAYVIACLVMDDFLRRFFVSGVIAVLPVALFLWMGAQWQIFNAIF